MTLERRASPERVEPKPRAFVRHVTTPPAAPWTQHQVATLDAHSGAPAPLDALLVVIKRVDPWRPGKPARFALGYVRRRDAPYGLTAEYEISGRMLHLRFEPERLRARRLRRESVLILALCCAVAILGVALLASLARRDAVGDALDRAELRARAMRRRGLEALRSEQDLAVLTRAGLSGAKLDQVLSELAHLDARRAPDATITAVRWRPSAIEVECRGLRPPLQDGVGLTETPGRPGHHVWRVTNLDEVGAVAR